MNKKFFKAFLSVLMVLVVMTFTPKEVEAKSFPDIPAKYEKEINYLVDLGIINGMPNGKFMPNNSLTRGEAYVMVARALKLDTTKQSTSFKDVPKNHYASGAVNSLLKKGIINSSTYLYPSKLMTRGEMATLLVKAFGYTKIDTDIYFFDVLEKNSLQQDIYKLVTAGIVNGYTDGTFKPNKSLTRTEFSILTVRTLDPSYRVYNRVLKKESYIVTASTLNVRSGPGTNYPVIAKLYENNNVDIYQISGNWAKTIINNKVGHLSTEYIRKLAGNSDFKIAIDAGHGGHDSGASGNGLLEKNINLAVAKYAKTELEKLGIEVFMTRSDDTYYTLQERVDMSVASNADAFLSIHTNSADSSSATGTETYYPKAMTAGTVVTDEEVIEETTDEVIEEPTTTEEEPTEPVETEEPVVISEPVETISDLTRQERSKKLATFVQKRLIEAWGLKDRGVKEGTFHVVYKNPLPAALLELGFINNTNDAKLLGSASMQQKAGKAVAYGVLDYINWLNTTK